MVATIAVSDAAGHPVALARGKVVARPVYGDG